MIAVLNYGMGNSSSILNMIRKAGGEARLCSSPSDLAVATAIILPGVGSFDNGMTKLEKSGLLYVLRQKVIDEGVPFLGICLGMQLLFDTSEEGLLPGLGWLNGAVTKFDFSKLNLSQPLKVPHMGWNLVKPLNFDSLYSGLEDEARFYFVHSYHVNCANESDILAVAHYGYEFTCSVQRGNILGVQFHPEKSHRFGIQFFKNFLKGISHA
ncbi:imidazole glycerol phosphate synthase subunit HisH [uncultured Endozoicomonas sp.]|uniref:imidazole glycerol phosphate synthase subunit HisH n=1 Tax=uncultured Endozoicomonas sp. TaxID=432652 RepID=UPI002639EAF3|nr:imidazole glycerol phosphate synthase subunit HisH [uncultured Endozoicomonas sp.]